MGHVTHAAARAKGDAESTLAITFDRAILKGGQEVPLNVAIQALASAQATTGGGEAETDAMDNAGAHGASATGSGGHGALGGVGSAAGGTVGTAANAAGHVGETADAALNSTASTTTNISGASRGAVGGLNAAGQLTSNSQGVFGLKGLNLSATASNAEASVITSAGKKVHLDSGTRMLLVTQSATPTAPRP